MNEETKAWYKEAKAKCIDLGSQVENGLITYDQYYKEMSDIAEYYIAACDFDRSAFNCED